MVFSLRYLSLPILLLLCFLLLLQFSSDGFNGAQSTLSSVPPLKETTQTSNRKVLVVSGLEAKGTVFKNHGKEKASKIEEEEGWELRAAPLGPDPLHHHGSDPKKPRTP
uniref:CLAVATA3 n=1 Tax=Gerbera hybrida TaxID=18101 RepID=A0A7T7FQZ9_GERHY|nr:CLAVATA3 [Gerbera hybrid cultivar]